MTGIEQSGIDCDQILLVDDCSPVPPPNWSDLVIPADDPQCISDKSIAVARFNTHLGRRQSLDHCTSPGWFRSFGYATRYAAAGNFEKIIHIESDTFIISPRLTAFINELDSGWSALWCPRHLFPEDNIQIIAGPQISEVIEFFNRPYSNYGAAPIERQYPLTNVVRSFIGDRYGEYRKDVPENADYAVQVPDYPDTLEKYCWWLRQSSITVPSHHSKINILAGAYDVVCAYNLFLFREPENRAVISNKLGLPIQVLIGTIITSLEFRERILTKLLNGIEIEFAGGIRIHTLKIWLLKVLPWDTKSRQKIVWSNTITTLIMEAFGNPGIMLTSQMSRI